MVIHIVNGQARVLINMLVDFEPQRKQKRTYTGSDVDNRLKTMYSIAEKRRGPGEAQSLRESAESGDLSKWTIYEPGNMFVLQMLYGRDPFVYGKNGAGIWTPKTQKDKELYFSDEAEATRNRRKSYLRRVSEHIDTTRYPTILSIGGGAGTEHIDFLREHPEKLKNTKVAVVDLNLEAVKRGNNWAEEQGFGDNILFVRGDAKKVGEYLNRMLPLLGRDEITCTTTEGLMDYMKPEDFQRIAKCSKQFMPKGSGFHTSNMARIGEICEYMNSGGWGTQNM